MPVLGLGLRIIKNLYTPPPPPNLCFVGYKQSMRGGGYIRNACVGLRLTFYEHGEYINNTCNMYNTVRLQ